MGDLSIFSISGLVQVQTLGEPEPDVKSGSAGVRFRVHENVRTGPKVCSRFREIWPELDLTGPQQHYLVGPM